MKRCVYHAVYLIIVFFGVFYISFFPHVDGWLLLSKLPNLCSGFMPPHKTAAKPLTRVHNPPRKAYQRTKKKRKQRFAQFPKSNSFREVVTLRDSDVQIAKKQKKILTRVGFEPTPFRTSELDVDTTLSWRLRPLGHLALLMWRDASKTKMILKSEEVVGVGLSAWLRPAPAFFLSTSHL
jgi:hypothetical protein